MAAGRKVKIPIIGTVNKTVFIDPNATRGATLGMDLFTPDGEVGTPDTVREWLGLTPLPPTNVEDDSGDGTTHHRLLEGLTLGDDHPQYTQWVQDEVITGAWTFENTLTFNFGGSASPYDWQAQDDEIHQYIPLRVTNNSGMLIENPTYPDAGIELITFEGDDPLNDGIGNQLAFWEVGTGGAFTPFSYGFRIRHTGDVDAEGNLDFYRHQNDTTGVLFLRFTRDSSQIQFTSGSQAAPVITHIDDLNTGIYFPSSDQVGIVSAGAQTSIWNGSANMVSTFRIHGPDGTNSAPAFSFSGDTNTGMYSAVANTLSFTTDGTERFSIGNTDTAGGGATRGIRSTLSFRGPAGSATVPAFTTTTDDNTGMYFPSADTIGFATGGTLRTSITTAAVVHTLPISEANGSAAAPSYAFTNDLDIGMYRAGTDILAFATAGTLRLAIDAGGGLGVGGTPSYGSAGQVLTSQGAGTPPIWSSAGSGVVAAVVAGNGISVDSTDPANPVVAVNQGYAFNWTADHTFADQVTVGAGAQAESSPILQVVNSADVLLNLYRFNNVAGGSAITMCKSRNATPGSHTIVQSGDSVFRMIGRGSDGAAFIPCAEMRFLIDSTPGTNDMPGRIAFYTTPDGSATQTEVMRLNNAGAMGFGGANFGTAGQILESQGSSAVPQWVDPPSGSSGVTVDVYTANDTWTKPAGTAWVEVVCIGQGGGGGGGSKRAVSNTRAGGGGGGGGGHSRAVIRASDLPSTRAVTVNGGGTGGTGATVDSNSGTAGTAGGDSSFGTNIRATGGGAGANGANNTNAGGAAGVGTVSDGGAGGTGGTTTTGTVGADSKYAGAGGGGGHGVSSANNVGTGLNNGGGVTLTNPALTGGAAGAAAGNAGGSGNTTGDAPTPAAGGGGGAGNGTANQNGGDGGDGGAYGGGGGGGAGATNGTGHGGDGGDGGSGVVIVISYPS